MGDAVERLAAQTHTVYFLDGSGRLIDEPRRVAHGQSAQPPDYTPPQGHVFLRWSRDVTHVKEDVYCVALTKAAETPPPAQPRKEQDKQQDEQTQASRVKEEPAQTFRVYVMDLRAGSPAGNLLPLGNWGAGEAINREDLACLHLRHAGRLRPFCVHVNCDTIIALTDDGVRAFDRNSMRPLDLMEIVSKMKTQAA